MADMDDETTSKGDSKPKPAARRRSPATSSGTRARRAPATPAAAKPATKTDTPKSEAKPVSTNETKPAAKSHAGPKSKTAKDKPPATKSANSVNWLNVGIGSAAAIGSAAVAAAMLYSRRNKDVEPPKSSEAPSLKDEKAGGD